MVHESRSYPLIKPHYHNVFVQYWESVVEYIITYDDVKIRPPVHETISERFPARMANVVRLQVVQTTSGRHPTHKESNVEFWHVMVLEEVGMSTSMWADAEWKHEVGTTASLR